MMFDMGILGAMIQLEPQIILDYHYGSYQGYFAENFVAQQLTAAQLGPIACWQHERRDVEFIVQSHGKVYPIEVKSGKK